MICHECYSPATGRCAFVPLGGIDEPCDRPLCDEHQQAVDGVRCCPAHAGWLERRNLQLQPVPAIPDPVPMPNPAEGDRVFLGATLRVPADVVRFDATHVDAAVAADQHGQIGTLGGARAGEVWRVSRRDVYPDRLTDDDRLRLQRLARRHAAASGGDRQQIMRLLLASQLSVGELERLVEGAIAAGVFDLTRRLDAPTLALLPAVDGL